jgi:hypothetical protein
MSNEFYTKTGAPASRSTGSSSTMRGEFVLIEQAFDKLPTLTAKGNYGVFVNAGATGLEARSPATMRASGLDTFRNKVINGNFAINQRAVSGTVTLAAGVYGHDGWKAGAAGATYTFSTSAGVTTLNISAGSLQQVIRGVDLRTQTYIMTWGGSAHGKIGAGSYDTAGVTSSVTGGSDLTIEFNTGTLSSVQFEPGDVESPFEDRIDDAEMILCLRRFERMEIGDAGWFASGFCDTTTLAQAPFGFFPKIAAPTITFGDSVSDWYVRHPIANTPCTVITAIAASNSHAKISATVASGLTVGRGCAVGALNASYVDITAEP